MSSFYVMLFSFMALSLLAFAQIVVSTSNTLLEAAQDSSASDQNLVKAYFSILQAHPELQLFTIVNTTKTTVNTTGTDYFIVLKGADNVTIMAVVSLEANMSAYFVSYIKVGTTQQPPPPNASNTTSPQAATTTATDNQQTPQATLDNSNLNVQSNQNKTLSLNALGGYHRLTNTNDVKFKMAIEYLRKIHPNLINYQLIAAAYQVVTGVNYLIQYNGLDNITKISAKVYVGFSGETSQLEFNVSCLYPFQPDCTDDMANQFYFGNEFVMNFHPELMLYRLLSIYVEEQTTSSITFMSTFENGQLALRAIAEIMVNSKGITILSFYSYRYL